MSAPSGWQRKLTLLFKSEKTLNAANIVKTFNNKSIDEMKATIVTVSMCDASALSNRPRTKDLESHLDNLKHQFIDQSELCFYHATLVVLLRRNYKPDETFAEFETLWTTQTDYLLENLSLRWLVSACDTFIDYSTNKIQATILMNVTTLINTLRVYETQQFLQSNPNSEPLPLVSDKINMLYHGDLPLYQGLTYFRIGTDDTLKHMRSRYESFYSTDELATTMLLSVFDKLQTNDSAFSTLRALHKDDNSKWWLDSH